MNKILRYFDVVKGRSQGDLKSWSKLHEQTKNYDKFNTLLESGEIVKIPNSYNYCTKKRLNEAIFQVLREEWLKYFRILMRDKYHTQLERGTWLLNSLGSSREDKIFEIKMNLRNIEKKVQDLGKTISPYCYQKVLKEILTKLFERRSVVKDDIRHWREKHNFPCQSMFNELELSERYITELCQTLKELYKTKTKHFKYFKDKYTYF
ncbi:gp138 [Sphingomonas phage PAU]|uniref:gp138 n=1 Tax=Sphingomonas phage PAU TaxID=1150991 RepID=UPI00025732D6|nr:gp138 [Sphingomonas phage PAU]AFF28136.1 gp138 [Sphingomonas phage PAU]